LKLALQAGGGAVEGLPFSFQALQQFSGRRFNMALRANSSPQNCLQFHEEGTSPQLRPTAIAHAGYRRTAARGEVQARGAGGGCRWVGCAVLPEASRGSICERDGAGESCGTRIPATPGKPAPFPNYLIHAPYGCGAAAIREVRRGFPVDKEASSMAAGLLRADRGGWSVAARAKPGDGERRPAARSRTLQGHAGSRSPRRLGLEGVPRKRTVVKTRAVCGEGSSRCGGVRAA